MWKLIKAEWLKMRRLQILLVGIVALALCPVVQYGSQQIVAPEYREAQYTFADLFANVIWGNSQIFLPISLVMIGGWCIDRETVHDTLKNIVTVPVSMSKLLSAKLLVIGFLSVLFGLYSVLATLLAGVIVKLPGLTAMLALQSGLQLTAAALMTCLVCMPMILIFGQIRGAYLGGSILTFFLGYSILFFKSGPLLSLYPFSAALILVRFDIEQYNGANTAPDIRLAMMGIGLMLLLTLLLLLLSNRRRERTSRVKASKRGNAPRRPR